MGLGAGSLIIG